LSHRTVAMATVIITRMTRQYCKSNRTDVLGVQQLHGLRALDW